MSKPRIAAALSLLCAPTLASAAQVSVTVSSLGDGDFTEIQEAINATSSDDIVVISIEPGTYAPITMARAGQVRLEALGNPSNTTIGGVQVANDTADLFIRGMQIQSEGARVARGTLRLHESWIASPGGHGRAAVEVAHDATASMDTVLIDGWHGGAAPIVAGRNATLTLDTVGVYDSEGERAGALFSAGATVIADTLITFDTRGVQGAGAVHVDGGTATFNDSEFERGAGAWGGGLRVTGNATVSATDTLFAGNEAAEGAHIRVESGTVALIRTTAHGASAERGGVIWQGGGSITVRNAAWDDNHALVGGAAIYQQAGTFDAAFATWTRMASGGSTSVHTGDGTATYAGVIIADTEGPAFDISGGATATYDDGLLWKINAGTAIAGDLSYDPNSAFQPPMFMAPDNNDYALRSTSAGLDVGVRGELDPDGTAADMGMYGGPEGWILEDLDGDGYVYGRDCVDVDDTINEAAVDTYYDGVDSNCDGASDFDQDGDGHDASAFAGGDCDDTDPSINPDAVETGGDKADADCDGFDHPDTDNDGWPANLDCDDSAADISPDAEDAWYDGIDQDCAGNDDFDQDGDGYTSAAFGGRDCDDTDPRRHPMYPDFAGDGIDQDCDGRDATVEEGEEDVVTRLYSEEETTVSPYAPPAMGAAPEGEAGMVSTGGCSVSGSSGSWALGLLAVFGLVGRRRD